MNQVEGGAESFYKGHETVIWGLAGLLVAVLLYSRLAGGSKPSAPTQGGSLAGGGGGGSASDPAAAAAAALQLQEAAAKFNEQLQLDYQKASAQQTLDNSKSTLSWLFPGLNDPTGGGTTTVVPPINPGGNPNGPPTVPVGGGPGTVPNRTLGNGGRWTAPAARG